MVDLGDPGSSTPDAKRNRYWLRAHGTISESGGLNVQLSALAYMSDNYFVGQVPLVHGIPPFRTSLKDEDTGRKQTDSEEIVKHYEETVERSNKQKTSSYPSPVTSSPGSKNRTPQKVVNSILKTSRHQQHKKSTVGIIVSLDHVIYFHRPREIRADDWLCSEMETPWAGAERGLVTQRIWNRHGRLVATCVQEVSEKIR